MKNKKKGIGDWGICGLFGCRTDLFGRRRGRKEGRDVIFGCYQPTALMQIPAASTTPVTPHRDKKRKKEKKF